MILFLFLGEKKEKERKRKNEKYSVNAKKRLVINYIKQGRHPSEWNTFFF